MVADAEKVIHRRDGTDGRTPPKRPIAGGQLRGS